MIGCAKESNKRSKADEIDVKQCANNGAGVPLSRRIAMTLFHTAEEEFGTSAPRMAIKSAEQDKNTDCKQATCMCDGAGGSADYCKFDCAPGQNVEFGRRLQNPVNVGGNG